MLNFGPIIHQVMQTNYHTGATHGIQFVCMANDDMWHTKFLVNIHNNNQQSGPILIKVITFIVLGLDPQTLLLSRSFNTLNINACTSGTFLKKCVYWLHT